MIYAQGWQSVTSAFRFRLYRESSICREKFDFERYSVKDERMILLKDESVKKSWVLAAFCTTPKIANATMATNKKLFLPVLFCPERDCSIKTEPAKVSVVGTSDWQKVATIYISHGIPSTQPKENPFAISFSHVVRFNASNCTSRVAHAATIVIQYVISIMFRKVAFSTSVSLILHLKKGFLKHISKPTLCFTSFGIVVNLFFGLYCIIFVANCQRVTSKQTYIHASIVFYEDWVV